MVAGATESEAVLDEAFFAREVRVVARDLLGRHLVRDAGTAHEIVARIVEVEAYGGQDDSASHCRHGRTARNAPMWGPPGRAYVYLCYGIHRMLNLVTGAEGEGQAVLVRACEPIAGLEALRERRGTRGHHALLSGPGCVGSGLAIVGSLSGESICRRESALQVRAGTPIAELDVLRGPRVGVDYASARDRRAPMRFAIAGSAAVTHRAGLGRARKSDC